MTDSTHNQRRLTAGEILFRMGDEGDAAYIVDSGTLDVYIEHDDGSELLLNEIAQGELVGEMALIDGRKRSASVRARSASMVTRISQAQLQERLERADPVIQLLLASTVERLRQRLEPEVPALAPVETAKGTAGAVARDSAQKRLRLESELDIAVAQEQFVMHYQPIVSLPGGDVAGFEALVRWQHPERGLLPPGAFVQAVEESHLMVDLGRWIMNESSQALVRFQGLADNPLFMGINVSGKQFEDPNFLGYVEALAELAVEPWQVKLEITESLLLTNPHTIEWLERCKELGFSIAIDDFGTGYSSLSYLHKLPSDTLKIDRSFVIAMLGNERSRVIVEFLIQLANGLGMRTVAEGIDDPETLQALIALRCDYVQGFLMARPMPEEKARSVLQQRASLLPS